MSHEGGVRKVPKKCHVLFEWPLNRFTVDFGNMNNIEVK